MARERYGNWWYRQEPDGLYRVYRGEGNLPVYEHSNLREILDYMRDQYIHELERRDVIGAIIQSTESLYARFGLTPDRANTLEKLTDEYAELIDELIPDEPNAAKIGDEFGDLMVTAVMAVRQHLTEHQMIDAVQAVCVKNNRKTVKNHELRGGTIKKKQVETV